MKKQLFFLKVFGKFYTLMFLFVALVMFALACAPATAEPTMKLNKPTVSGEQVEVPVPTEDVYFSKRKRMVDLTIVDRGISDPKVIQAMRTVPRHEFVPDEYKNLAYIDEPLPIGYGQTISQPYMVAWMTELLELQPGEKVLEIGTGSGYQAAVLAELEGVEVYSVEIIPELAQEAADRLKKLGYTDVRTKQGDGYFGWEEHAPYDAIIVTAAPDHLPPLLVDQLTDDGRIVIPIGPPGSVQTLWKFVIENGELKGYNLGGVRFVPFTGAAQGGVSTPDLQP